MNSVSVFRSLVLLGATPFLAGVCDTTQLALAPEVERTFSFETSLEQWTPSGTDLDGPPVEWDVSVSGEEAAEGSHSVRLHLNNLNDAAKIWIQRPFDLSPNQAYDVVVSYALGTSDTGSATPWTLLTGVHLDAPVTRDHLTPQGDTGRDPAMGDGVVWTDKSFTFQARTGADARLWVSVGVWGTSGVERDYWIDDLTVSFTQR